MATKTPDQYKQLVTRIATDFDPNFEFDSRDLPMLSDDELALAIRHEEYVALDSFTAAFYADILNSAVYMTEEAKALAFWREMGRASRESAKDVLAESINEELQKWREPEALTQERRAGAL